MDVRLASNIKETITNTCSILAHMDDTVFYSNVCRLVACTGINLSYTNLSRILTHTCKTTFYTNKCRILALTRDIIFLKTCLD